MSEEHLAQVKEAAAVAVQQIEQFEQQPEQAAPEAQEQAAPEAQEQEQAEPELIECPRCGHNLAHRQVEPDEKDVQEYVRCLMSNKIFSKTYPLFGGELTLRFSLLTGAESDLLSDALKKLNRDDFVTHAAYAMRLKLLFYLRRFDKDELQPPEESGLEKLWELYNERYGNRGEDVPVLLIKVLLEFLRLSELLPATGLDKNFYKGAGLS